MKVGFIGAGNMGSALAKAISIRENVNLYIYDKDAEKAEALAKSINATASDNRTIARECDFVFLAVKPGIIPAAAKEISDLINDRENVTVVSMAAGVAISSITEAFGSASVPIIRIMPNTPVALCCGMTLWCKNGRVSDEVAKSFTDMMSATGHLDEISEKSIDAASAVSGCGPAFVYMFIEALADGGVECGLTRDKALLYAAKTLSGAAEMVIQGVGHPEELKDAVCSPGGSTIAGVHALEEGAFRATAANAVISAYKKTLTLGK